MNEADKIDLIRIRLQMLMAVFGKRLADEHQGAFYDVYLRNLEKYPVGVLTKAFAKAEQELERFPTPKILREICNSEMPSQTWKYHYKDATDDEGIPCKVDPETGEHLYLPQNCPEGREFLAKLSELAEKKSSFSS